MATNFPGGLDSFTNPTSGDTLDSPDHAGQHADVNDAVEAIELALLDGAPLFVDDANNRVGIGTTSPSTFLHVADGSSGVTSHNSEARLIVESSGDATIEVATPNSGTGYLRFIDPDNNAAGGLSYDHSTDLLAFRTSGSNEMVIDSSGNVGIGTTSPSTILDVNDDITIRGGGQIMLEGTTSNYPNSINFHKETNANYWHMSGPRGTQSDSLTTYWYDGSYTQVLRLNTNGDVQASGSLTAEGPDGGLVMRNWQANAALGMFGTANMNSQEYSVLTDGTNTYISAGAGGIVYLRGPNNDTSPQLSNNGSTLLLDGGGTSNSTFYITGGNGLDLSGPAQIKWANNDYLQYNDSTDVYTFISDGSTDMTLDDGYMSLPRNGIDAEGTINTQDGLVIFGDEGEAAINGTYANHSSIQFETDTYWGGVNPEHTGFMIACGGMSGWGTSQLYFRGSNNWASYYTDSAMRLQGVSAYITAQNATTYDCYIDGSGRLGANFSRRDLKENIVEVDNSASLSRVLALKPVEFTWKRDASEFPTDYMEFDVFRGFIAEDVAEVDRVMATFGWDKTESLLREADEQDVTTDELLAQAKVMAYDSKAIMADVVGAVQAIEARLRALETI